MTTRVFISYSSPDQKAAEAIREALEGAGLACWIAPRDLAPGTQWGAGIVQAILACEAVLVVFSDAANNSPQVAREMELAVANRRPLIPIRVADAMPTDDMQYFLGVSHWLNAYEAPLASYLPAIVTAVRGVLARQRNPWANLQRRLPKTRGAQIALTGAGVVLIVLIVAMLMRPPNPMDAMRSPLAGRWQTKIPDGNGGKATCVMDVQKMGLATFSDSCPDPLTSATGPLTATKDGVWAPTLYKAGDTGSFLFQGAGGFSAAFHIGWLGLQTRDARYGALNWHKISAAKPLQSDVSQIVPAPAAWPLEGVPQIAKNATTYVRAKWKSDAQLIAIDAKLLKSNEGGIANVQTSAGGVELAFDFYSPSTQQGMHFMPGSPAGALFAEGVIDRNGEGPLPASFLDLPQAVNQLASRGMRAKQIYEAQIQDWGSETTAGDARMSGVEWMIDSQLDERFVVRAN